MTKGLLVADRWLAAKIQVLPARVRHRFSVQAGRLGCLEIPNIHILVWIQSFIMGLPPLVSKSGLRRTPGTETRSKKEPQRASECGRTPDSRGARRCGPLR